jgi:Mycothiol maleylpyruvate isomerase N-terminal domain.
LKVVRSELWTEARSAFGQAADWFVRTTAAPPGRWDETALGEWTVRDLVGHTSRALLTVETYLDRPVASVEVSSPVDYFRAVLASTGDPAAVAQRGREAGAALGDDIPAAVAQLAERALSRVNAEHADARVATPVGGMRLGDYLPTRTFELTVHTCDLAVALDQPLDVPQAAASGSLAVLSGLVAPNRCNRSPAVGRDGPSRAATRVHSLVAERPGARR